MKQIVEIEVPDGKKAVWKDGKIIFEDIKPKLPKTWEEFCKNYPCKKDECYMTTDCGLYSIIGGIERNISNDRNLLPSKQAVEQHLTLMQLHQLRDCYRQGWEPNWEDDSFKYTIVQDIFNKDKKYSIKYYCYTSYFLSFPTYKLAEEFLTNFRDLIEKAGDLI